MVVNRNAVAFRWVSGVVDGERLKFHWRKDALAVGRGWSATASAPYMGREILRFAQDDKGAGVDSRVLWLLIEMLWHSVGCVVWLRGND